MKLQYISQQRKIIRSFYTGIGKTAVLFPSAFFTAVGMGVVSLGIIFYIREIFFATASQVGYFTALWSLCYIIGCIIIQPLFNRVLPRYLLIGASFLMFLCVSCILFTEKFLFAYLFYGLFGLATSFFWTPLMGWLSHDIEGVELGKIMSRFNFSWSAGIIISSPLAGVLSDIAPEIPIYSGGFLFLLTCFLITGASFKLSKIRSDTRTDPPKSARSQGIDKSTPLRFPAWVGIFMTWVAMGIILNIFPVFARDELDLSKGLIGILLQSRAVSATVGFILIGQWTFWHFKIVQMVIGQLFLAAIIFLMSFTSSPLLLTVLITFIGFINALSYSNSIFHGVSGSANRAGRMAIHESILSAGFICGSALGGLLYQYYGMNTVYFLCAAMALFGVLVQSGLYVLICKSKR